MGWNCLRNRQLQHFAPAAVPVRTVGVDEISPYPPPPRLLPGTVRPPASAPPVSDAPRPSGYPTTAALNGYFAENRGGVSFFVSSPIHTPEYRGGFAAWHAPIVRRLSRLGTATIYSSDVARRSTCLHTVR